MSDETPTIQPENSSHQSKGEQSWRHTLIFGIAAVCMVIVGYVAYSFIMKNRTAPSDDAAKQQQKVLQLDVLNGCGAKGAAAKVTNLLRTSGFDVVEVKNYKTFGVPHTLVLDRIGDLNAAKRVARALGVSDDNIVQQINPDYFVNVSVIIGADYSSLKTAM